jgi:hypothetical protein
MLYVVNFVNVVNVVRENLGLIVFCFVLCWLQIFHYRIPEKAKYDLHKFVRLFAKKKGLDKPVKNRTYASTFKHFSFSLKTFSRFICFTCLESSLDLFRPLKEQRKPRGYMNPNEYEDGEQVVEQSTPTVQFIA